MDLTSHATTIYLRLEEYLVQRDVRAGFALLDESFPPGAQLIPGMPASFDLLLALAQWADLGYRDLAFFECQFRLFATCSPLQLTVGEYLHLKVAESYLLLAGRRYAEAAELLHSLVHVSKGIVPPHLLFVAHFWLGRALRQAGTFDQALENVRIARRHAEDMKASKLIAVTKIHESWLVFHRGERRLAFALLDEAETALKSTGHVLSLGNIASARGRFIRSTGEYERALGFFEQAIAIYRPHYPEHPNLARALVNTAYVKRLLALELQRGRGEPATAVTHAQVLTLAHDAMALLQEAARIYATQQHQAGTGSVLINFGHLKLEIGEIDAAAEQGDTAYALGKEKDDPVLMARARILQAYVQMAYAEEQLGDPLSPVSPSQQAVEFAEDAVRLAEGTHNRRLVAGAYITRGLAAADMTSPDWDLARSCAARGGNLLGTEDRDHLFRELNNLKRKITQPHTLEDMFRRWSNGELGGKSFQQIEEEFAEIVIPKVWMTLGRNISRVAQELNISPKKVRRVLRNARSKEQHSQGPPEKRIGSAPRNIEK